MKQQIAIVVSVCLVQFAFAQSEELKLFDEYHSQYNRWLSSEVEVLRAKDAEAASFQARVNKKHQVWGQLERIVFTNIVASDPARLDWTAPTFWATGFLSTNLYAEIKRTDPRFRTLAEQYERLDNDLRLQERAADRLREVRQQSQTELKPLERTFYHEMMGIQKKLEELRKERAQPTSAGDVLKAAPEK